MKILKELLELIVAIAKAWPYLLGGLLFIVSVIVELSTGLASVTIQISLSLPVVIIIIALASYPIAKFIEWLIKGKRIEPFIFDGLLWKPSRLSFMYPTPICPHQGCGCRVYYKTDSSVSLRPIHGTPHWQAHNGYIHIYECPQHGRLSVSNIDIDELRKKAKIFHTSQFFTKQRN